MLEHDIITLIYPQQGDMVWILGTDPQPWLAKVTNIYVDTNLKSDLQ